MKPIQRRLFALGVLAVCAGAVCMPFQAQAQGFPSRPIRIVVGQVPGGVTDLLARALGPGMGRFLGQTVIVENKPGAGSAIANEYIAKQVPPDGHMLLLTNPGLSTYRIFTKELRFDALKDLNHISILTEGQLVLWTNTQTP